MRAVLTYHSIDDSGSPISVSADQFEAHCSFLSSAQLDVVSLHELMDGDDPATPRLAITFDDGFVNFTTHALPILLHHGLPATLFVVTGKVGQDNAWTGSPQTGIPTLPLLDWDGLAHVSEEGITLGAHTHTHPRLSECSSAELHDEITRPVAVLRERMGVEATTFAYPYGDHDPNTVALTSAHYALACTTELKTVSAESHAHMLPRLDMYYFRERGRLESIGSSQFRAYLSFRRALRKIRSVLGQ